MPEAAFLQPSLKSFPHAARVGVAAVPWAWTVTPLQIGSGTPIHYLAGAPRPPRLWRTHAPVSLHWHCLMVAHGGSGQPGWPLLPCRCLAALLSSRLLSLILRQPLPFTKHLHLAHPADAQQSESKLGRHPASHCGIAATRCSAGKLHAPCGTATTHRMPPRPLPPSCFRQAPAIPPLHRPQRCPLWAPSVSF